MKYLICLVFILSQFITTTATIRYVSKTGSSTAPYTSWATAADSIQKCIDFSQSGDTIYVANGTYYEQVIMIPELALIGSGMDSCVIDTRALATPQDFYSVRVMENCLLKGFHIIVSPQNWGIGTYLWHSDGLKATSEISYLKITNCAVGAWLTDLDNGYFRHNIIQNVDQGVKVSSFYNSQSIVENNYISNIPNIGQGIQISFGGNPIIRNNSIIDNRTIQGIWCGSPNSIVLKNNLLILTELQSPAIQLTLPSTICTNNLLIGNNDEGISARNNNIVFNNSVLGFEHGIINMLANENPIIKYNNSWNNDINYSNFNPDSTNLSVDPMFLDANNRDFHLQAYSPLIDAGDPNVYDIDGSRSDIGLYGGPNGASYQYIDLPPKSPRNILANLDTGIVNLLWAENTESDFKYYNIYRDTVNNFIIDSTKLIASTVTAGFLEPVIGSSNLYYKLTAVDGQGNESLPSREVVILIVGVEEPEIELEDFILYQNYPNPFNPSTTIGYRITKTGHLKLNVYDIKGEKITELVNEYQSPGYYEIKFTDTKTGEDIASGIYLYKLDVIENGIPVFTSIKKMLRLK